MTSIDKIIMPVGHDIRLGIIHALSSSVNPEGLSSILDELPDILTYAKIRIPPLQSTYLHCYNLEDAGIIASETDEKEQNFLNHRRYFSLVDRRYAIASDIVISWLKNYKKKKSVSDIFGNFALNDNGHTSTANIRLSLLEHLFQYEEQTMSEITSATSIDQRVAKRNLDHLISYKLVNGPNSDMDGENEYKVSKDLKPYLWSVLPQPIETSINRCRNRNSSFSAEDVQSLSVNRVTKKKFHIKYVMEVLNKLVDMAILSKTYGLDRKTIYSPNLRSFDKDFKLKDESFDKIFHSMYNIRNRSDLLLYYAYKDGFLSKGKKIKKSVLRKKFQEISKEKGIKSIEPKATYLLIRKLDNEDYATLVKDTKARKNKVYSLTDLGNSFQKDIIHPIKMLCEYFDKDLTPRYNDNDTDKYFLNAFSEVDSRYTQYLREQLSNRIDSRIQILKEVHKRMSAHSTNL